MSGYVHMLYVHGVFLIKKKKKLLIFTVVSVRSLSLLSFCMFVVFFKWFLRNIGAARFKAKHANS